MTDLKQVLEMYLLNEWVSELVDEWMDKWKWMNNYYDHTNPKYELIDSIILFHSTGSSEASEILGSACPTVYPSAKWEQRGLGMFANRRWKYAKNAFNDYSFQCSCLSINSSFKLPTKHTCSSLELKLHAFRFHITCGDRHAWEWESFRKHRCGPWCGLLA